jgi:hypothetical protein
MTTDTKTEAVTMSTIDRNVPWYKYIDQKRRHNFLRILEALSRQQNKHDPEFMLIGALTLVMQNYLHYLAWWDIDLLFRDEEILRKFAKSIAVPDLQIEPLDDEIISTGDIVCLHTMWSFGHTWANVDYIYRPERFHFFYETLKNRTPFSQTVMVDNCEYHISLLLAHPWDIFVDKLTLSRTVEQLQQKDAMGIDLRHIVFILQRDGADQNFWKHLIAKSDTFGRKDVLKTVLSRIIEIAPELGYKDVCNHEVVSRYFGTDVFLLQT